MTEWVDAVKEQLKLKMTIDGPTGAGKSYTALAIAEAIASYGNRRVLAIDTEGRKLLHYADRFVFKHKALAGFSPERYTESIKSAEEFGADVLVIDSLSHAWRGKGGALEQVDLAAKRGGDNSYTAWRDVTPKHNEMVEAINQANIHIIVTMRSEMDYVLEPNAQNKMVPKRVGLAPVQRKGMEYEFDIVADMDQSHVLTVSKSRCFELDSWQCERPTGIEFAQIVMPWLNSGVRPLEMITSLEHPVVQEWRAICRKAIDAGHDTWVIRRSLPTAVDLFIHDIKDLCLKLHLDYPSEASLTAAYEDNGGIYHVTGSELIHADGLPGWSPNKQLIMTPQEDDPSPEDEAASLAVAE